jgi:hypothetical protein
VHRIGDSVTSWSVALIGSLAGMEAGAEMTKHIYKWRWKYFTRNELDSPDDGSLVINEDAIDKLERMRELMGVPLKINSAYRSKKHNAKVEGAEGSMHRQGRAFDISNKGHDPAELYQAAVKAGFTRFGFARTYLHVDTGNPPTWWEYGKGNRAIYVKASSPAINAIPKALSIEKETEAPNKIEGVPLSDKQKIAVATTTGVVGAGGVTTIISEPQFIVEHGPSAIAAFFKFLQSSDWRVALAAILVCGLFGLIWWIWKGRR